MAKTNTRPTPTHTIPPLNGWDYEYNLRSVHEMLDCYPPDQMLAVQWAHGGWLLRIPGVFGVLPEAEARAAIVAAAKAGPGHVRLLYGEGGGGVCLVTAADADTLEMPAPLTCY